MNKRINELVKEAGGRVKSVCHGHGDYRNELQLSDEQIEKFAELMIVEFSDVVKQTAIVVAQTAYHNGETEADVNRRVNAVMRVLDVMRERFGVEE